MERLHLKSEAYAEVPFPAFFLMASNSKKFDCIEVYEKVTLLFT